MKPTNTVFLWSSKILFCVCLKVYFLKPSYSQRCFDVAQCCENRRWKWKHCFNVVYRSSNQRWNRQRWVDVVQHCKFQRWRIQHCFNVDLTMLDVVMWYQPKHSVETTLKSLLVTGSNKKQIESRIVIVNVTKVTWQYKCCLYIYSQLSWTKWAMMIHIFQNQPLRNKYP